MGRVFRAHDTRLDRDVAIKVLLESAAGNLERVQRFEREARVIGALTHPNIVVIHDVGRDGPAPYLVTELLEGATLRDRLRAGPLPEREAVTIALDITRALEAAHGKGITHRDLKPENVFLTRDGQVKVLDFGLAHFSRGAQVSETDPTVSRSGEVMGTAGYMAPEQIRGRPVDQRADLFAVGAVLYELLCGQRAFPGDTAVDRGLKALNSEPPHLSSCAPDVSPALTAVVGRCLQKRPEDRFQSAHELADALEHYREYALVVAPGPPPSLRWRKELWVGAVATLAVLLGLIALGLARQQGRELLPRPRFTQVTFRLSAVGPARFAPDGQTILFTATFKGQPQVFAALPGWMEVRPLTEPGYSLSAVSLESELAVIHNEEPGRLGRVGMTSSAVREVADHADLSDFHSSGQLLIVQHLPPLRSVLEYPIGKVLLEVDGGLDSCRFSPRGDRIACLRRAPGVFSVDAPAVLLLVDLEGRTEEVGGWWDDAFGLAWASADELWLSASRGAEPRGLHAVGLRGAVRPLVVAPTELLLHDLSASGRALIQSEERGRAVRLVESRGEERDLSWLGDAAVVDLTADGERLLLTGDRGTFLRPADGSAAVQVAEGVEGRAVSSDGSLVVACGDPPRCSRRTLIPTGVGTPSELPRGKVVQFSQVRFFDQDRQIVFAGRAEGEAQPRLWTQRLDGEPVPITPLGLHSPVPSPDGRWFAAVQDAADRTSSVVLVPVAGGPPVAIRGENQGRPVGWTRNGRLVVAQQEGEARVLRRVDPSGGPAESWRTLQPPERGGFQSFEEILAHPSGAIAYSFRWGLGDLYLVEGLESN